MQQRVSGGAEKAEKFVGIQVAETEANSNPIQQTQTQVDCRDGRAGLLSVVSSTHSRVRLWMGKNKCQHTTLNARCLGVCVWIFLFDPPKKTKWQRLARNTNCHRHLLVKSKSVARRLVALPMQGYTSRGGAGRNVVLEFAARISSLPVIEK